MKIDEEGKKVIERSGRGRLGKYLNEKRKSIMVPKPGLQEKKHTFKGTQTKKKNQIRCKMLQ